MSKKKYRRGTTVIETDWAKKYRQLEKDDNLRARAMELAATEMQFRYDELKKAVLEAEALNYNSLSANTLLSKTLEKYE